MKKKRIMIIVGILVLILVGICVYVFTRNITIRFIDDEKVIKEVSVARGDVISLPEVSKEGYAFIGWYYNDEKLGKSAWFNKNATVIAKWELEPKMTISFDTDGGEPLDKITVICNKPLSLPKPVKKGYKFASWLDSEGKSIDEDSKIACEDITLKASWEEIKLNGKYSSTDLGVTLRTLNLEKKYSHYNPSDDAITIYLFYGSGCVHCHHFLEFLSSIADEYGTYFNLKAYEVWENEDNLSLMNEVSAHLNSNVKGVPYIIIGKEEFKGYAESSNEGIKRAIKELYDTDKAERYDIINELSK